MHVDGDRSSTALALRVLRLHLRRRGRGPRRRDPARHGVRRHPRDLVLSGLWSAQARLHPIRGLIVSKQSQALPPAQRALARLTGARLCFGRPVELESRTVIPVASVRTAGGWGFGNQYDGSGSGSGSGGGGGGALDARPVGFIEIS